MKNATTHAAASSLVQYSLKKIKLHEKATRRQQKHDMLLDFIDQAYRPKQKPQPARPQTSILKSLLSIFL